MEENKTQKINFFKKVWYSVTKFEKYPDMAAEGVFSAIKYLIIITVIISIFAAISSLIQMDKLVNQLASYIQSDIPEFSYADGKITMDIQEPIIFENVQYSGVDRIVLNPLAESDEQKSQSQQENNINGTTIFFFKDQIILRNKTENDQVATQPYTYKDFIASYTQENVESFDKAELVEYITSDKMSTFYTRYGVSLLIYITIMNVLVALLDTLELAILGWITTIVARIKMRFVAIYNMAIYSLTLPIILNIIYIVINYFTTFAISYFQVAYITIAYIYLAAAIFILKDDVIKKKEEVEKIKQEQQKVRDEMREQEEKKKEEKPKKKEKKEEKEEDVPDGEEPKGSEA